MKATVRNELITESNVKLLGETIAIQAVKTVMRYTGESMFRVYKGLVQDVNSPSSERNLSDGYDIAQTAICFLCGHIGKRMYDGCGVDGNGAVITIRRACYSETNRYIENMRNRRFAVIAIDDLNECDEPTVEFEQDTGLDDWTRVDGIIELMGLNKGQADTLNCYMSGMRFVETAKFLDVNISTVWRRMDGIRKRYNERVAVPG